MCQISYNTFSGADFIATLGGQLTAVGSFNAAAIDLDQASNQEFSQPGIAASLVTMWASQCGLNLSLVSTEICNTLKQGYKYMVLYMYYRLYIATQIQCGCECGDAENKALEYYENQACCYFGQVAPCISNRFKLWAKSDCVPNAKGFIFNPNPTTIVNGCSDSLNYDYYTC